MKNNPSRFEKVNIEITKICNFKCSFCPAPASQTWMPLAVFKDILEQVKPLTKEVCLHLLGEPLTHPEFTEIIKHCESQNTPVEIVTNGTLLKSTQIQALLNPTVRQINFSLQSFLDNRPGEDPKAYLDKIFRFVDLAIIERPELYINFRFWNLTDNPYNMKNKAAVFNSPSQDKLDRTLSLIGTHFGDFQLGNLDFRNRKSVHLKERLYLHFDSRFDWPDLELPFKTQQGTCRALKHHIGVLSDGTVVPCCLDHRGDNRLGNLTTKPLSQILQSPLALKIKEGFQCGELRTPLCQRCQFAERFSKPPVLARA